MAMEIAMEVAQQFKTTINMNQPEAEIARVDLKPILKNLIKVQNMNSRDEFENYFQNIIETNLGFDVNVCLTSDTMYVTMLNKWQGLTAWV